MLKLIKFLKKVNRIIKALYALRFVVGIMCLVIFGMIAKFNPHHLSRDGWSTTSSMFFIAGIFLLAFSLKNTGKE